MATKEVLMTPVAPPEIKGAKTFNETLGISQPYLTKKSQIQQGINKAESDILAGEQKQKEILATAEQGAVQKQAEDIRAAQEKYQGRLQAEPLPAFIPTKDDVSDIAGLFSLINVISMVAGKGDAQLALGNMNGMLEGYQKGRADLYKKEATEFDKNFKVMLKKHEEFRKEMEDAIKLAPYDKETAMAEANMAAVKAGSSIVKAKLDKGDLVGAYNLVTEAQKGVERAKDAYDKEVAKKEEMAQRERQHRENLAEKEKDRQQRERIAKAQMAMREKLAKAAADAKAEAAKKGVTLKPGAKITEGYVADTVLKSDIEGLKRDLKNPKLVEQLKQYRVEAFLTEEGKVLNQVLSSEIPVDLQKFLTKVRDIRNNYYLNISGKAVTGGEALRSYGTVPQPGDDAQGMINKLDGMAGRVNESIELKRQLFGLPELNLNSGMKTNLKQNEDYTINSQTSFEVNKVYTDSNGNKAKYLGNDEWEEIE